MKEFVLFSRKTRKVTGIVSGLSLDEVTGRIHSLGLEYHRNGRWTGYGKFGTKDTDIQAVNLNGLFLVI